MKLRLIINLNLETARVLDVASAIALIFVLIERLLVQLARCDITIVEWHAAVLEVATCLISVVTIAVRNVALIVEVCRVFLLIVKVVFDRFGREEWTRGR